MGNFYTNLINFLLLILLFYMITVSYKINTIDKKFYQLKKLVIIQDSLLIKSIEDINGNK